MSHPRHRKKQTISYRIRPSSGPIVSWGPDIYTTDIADHDGEGWLQHSIQTTFSVELPRLTTVSAAILRSRQRLIPREFDAVSDPLQLPENRWAAELTTSAPPRTTLDLQYHGGEQIDFFPAAGVQPFSTNARTIVSTLEIHPSDSMTVQNNVIYTALSSTFIHHCANENQLSILARAFGAHDHRSRSAQRQSCVNGVSSAGYNTNNDRHRQVFVKMSYLVRF